MQKPEEVWLDLSDYRYVKKINEEKCLIKR